MKQGPSNTQARNGKVHVPHSKKGNDSSIMLCTVYVVYVDLLL